jgi:hypothetical protein
MELDLLCQDHKLQVCMKCVSSQYKGEHASCSSVQPIADAKAALVKSLAQKQDACTKLMRDVQRVR